MLGLTRYFFNPAPSQPKTIEDWAKPLLKKMEGSGTLYVGLHSETKAPYAFIVRGDKREELPLKEADKAIIAASAPPHKPLANRVVSRFSGYRLRKSESSTQNSPLSSLHKPPRLTAVSDDPPSTPDTNKTNEPFKEPLPLQLIRKKFLDSKEDPLDLIYDNQVPQPSTHKTRLTLPPNYLRPQKNWTLD